MGACGLVSISPPVDLCSREGLTLAYGGWRLVPPFPRGRSVCNHRASPSFYGLRQQAELSVMPPTAPLGDVEVDVFLDECGEHPAMALFRVQLEATEDRVRCPLLDLLKVEPQGGWRGETGFQFFMIRRLPVHGIWVGRSGPLGVRPAPVPMPLGGANFPFFRSPARKERVFNGRSGLLRRHVSVVVARGLRVFFQKLGYELLKPDTFRRVGKEHVGQVAGGFGPVFIRQFVQRDAAILCQQVRQLAVDVLDRVPVVIGGDAVVIDPAAVSDFVNHRVLVADDFLRQLAGFSLCHGSAH